MPTPGADKTIVHKRSLSNMKLQYFNYTLFVVTMANKVMASKWAAGAECSSFDFVEVVVIV